MLTEVTSRINKRIAVEEDIQSFRELISESELFNIDTLLDANFKNLNENGDDLVMFKDFERIKHIKIDGNKGNSKKRNLTK